MHRLNFVIGLALLFSMTAVADSTVVATVGNKNITLDDFNKRYDEVRKQTVNPPPKKVFLEDLIRYEMGVQEAEKIGLDKDPIVAERMREELYKGLVEKELSDKINAITVSDEEMKDFYKTSPEIRTSHILIEVKPNATPTERAAAKKRADEIYAEVEKSKQPFEKLVKLYTDDIATKDKDGDTGYQSRMSVVPSYYDAAVKLKIGRITGVVETPYGFHIIKLTGRRSFADSQKRSSRAAVFEKKRLAIFNDYFEKLRKHYKISVNAENLK